MMGQQRPSQSLHRPAKVIRKLTAAQGQVESVAAIERASDKGGGLPRIDEHSACVSAFSKLA